MQLSYRGIVYASQAATINAIETEQTGLFLGQPFKMKQFHVAQRQAETVQLKYRGSDYTC